MNAGELSVWICTVLLVIDAGYSAKVLGIFSYPQASNFRFNLAILESLHEAGHQITFLTPFASELRSSPNFTVIDISGNKANIVGGVSPFLFARHSFRETVQFVSGIEERYCSEVVNTQTIKDALSSKIKFDVMLTQMMLMPQCQLKIAQLLKIPVIGTTAFRKEVPTLDTGNPVNPSSFAHIISSFDARMSFTERLLNTWYYVLGRYLEDTLIQPKVTKFLRKHFNESPAPPNISPSLVFANSHSSVLPRPLVPGFIEVAGIHIRPPKPLSSTLQKFVDEAESGVILFTYGSIIAPSQIPAEVVNAFFEVFASIPQRVIWKYDVPRKNVSDNVLLMDWVPQRDLLEHENVIAFISHCGVAGMLEAIHTATPVITTPIFSDQHSNAVFLRESGVAVQLSTFDATKKEIFDAVNAIVNETRFSENMQKLSERFRDRPLTPKESVVYWTEFVIRHRGAAHLRTAAADMPLYQYLLLDVILFICAVSAAVFYAIYFIVTRACRLKKRSSIEELKKKE